MSAFGSSWGSAWGSTFGSSDGAGVGQPAAGPTVVLFPRDHLVFRTRGDLALYALAVYTKDCAVRVRQSFEPLMPLRTVSARDALRV